MYRGREMHDDDHEDTALSLSELRQRIDADLATLRARAALRARIYDVKASTADRRRAIQELLSSQRQAQRVARKRLEALVHDAYGDGASSPTWQTIEASFLIEIGLVTQDELDAEPMDVMLALVHQRLTEWGIRDQDGPQG